MGSSQMGQMQGGAGAQMQQRQGMPPLLQALLQMAQQVLTNPQALQMFRQELMQTHDPELAAAELIAMVSRSVLGTAAQQGAAVPQPVVSQLLIRVADMVMTLAVKMQVLSVQQAQQLARPVLAMAVHTFKNGRGSVAGKPLPSLRRSAQSRQARGMMPGQAMQQGGMQQMMNPGAGS